MKKTLIDDYEITEESFDDGNTVTWVKRPRFGVIRGFWDRCPVTRRGRALSLATDLADGSKYETKQDVYGPAKEWTENEPLREGARVPDPRLTIA